jgi:hypothetical protein
VKEFKTEQVTNKNTRIVESSRLCRVIH